MFYIGGENVRRVAFKNKDRGRKCSTQVEKMFAIGGENVLRLARIFGKIIRHYKKSGALLPRCKNVLYFLHIMFYFV